MRPSVLVTTLGVLLCAAGSATAQTAGQPPLTTVTGTITDASTGVPLAGASITFKRAGKTVWTDDHGHFALSKVETGEDQLTVEQLGYKDGQFQVQIGNAPGPLTLALQPDPVLLKGLAVVARRLNSRAEAMIMSVRAFSERDMQLSGGWSVGDFLRSRGAFIATHCNYAFTESCVWSRGQFVPMRIYLDNMRLLGGVDELETIPVSDLYRVEVFQRGIYVQLLTRNWALRNAEHAGRDAAFLPPLF